MPAATAANDMHTVWMFAIVTCATRLTSAEFSYDDQSDVGRGHSGRSREVFKERFLL